MQGESSSAESKVTAISGPVPYKCDSCSRVFKTSRARCGHQMAHRKARKLRGKPYGPVLAAVLIHHIPSDDEEGKGPVGAGPEGNGSSDDPVKLDDDKGIKPEGNEPKDKPTPKAVQAKPRAKSSAGPSPRRRDNRKPVGVEKSDEHHDDHQPQQQQKKKKRLRTRDLLGQWNPTRNNVEDGVHSVEAFEGSTWKVTLDLGAKVLGEWGHGDDLNLELQLCSAQYVEEVDLELKLGF